MKKYQFHLCDCGRRATLRRDNAWQCRRCASIKPDEYHNMTAGIRLMVNEWFGITKGTRHE
jgi:ribosomal protein L37AE/L43A